MSNAFWHGFADMNAISANGPLVMTKGEGSWVWDDKGKKYFDAAGALWYMNVGHGRKEIGEAMAAQASNIASYSSFGECTTAPTIELADLVAYLEFTGLVLSLEPVEMSFYASSLALEPH